MWCLLTKGVDGRPTCRKPLVLCPSSLVQVGSVVLGFVLNVCVRAAAAAAHLQKPTKPNKTQPKTHHKKKNWGKEFARWLGERVAPIVVDDTRAAAVKDAMKVWVILFVGFSWVLLGFVCCARSERRRRQRARPPPPTHNKPTTTNNNNKPTTRIGVPRLPQPPAAAAPQGFDHVLHHLPHAQGSFCAVRMVSCARRGAFERVRCCAAARAAAAASRRRRRRSPTHKNPSHKTHHHNNQPTPQKKHQGRGVQAGRRLGDVRRGAPAEERRVADLAGRDGAADAPPPAAVR